MSILVENVTKLFGSQKALDNVSLSIPSNQVVGFLGPNGAGKSTLMRIITGFIPPTQGRVEVNGIPILSDKEDFRRNVGYLPENNPLYPDLYVKEYLQFVAKIYGLGRVANARVRNLIEQTGIGHEQNKRIGQLSKGYKQRVGLAQALLNQPKVLILDEPTSGLDPNQLVEIRNLIVEAGQDKTVMLSTHIMQEVEAMCQRVIIINRGTIVADGLTGEVLALNSANALEILIEYAQEVESSTFQTIPHVTKAFHISGNSWSIQTDGTDIREQLFNHAVDKGYTIIGMRLRPAQLQDVFQQLTYS